MLFAEKHRTTFPYEGKVPSSAKRMRWSFWHKTSLPLLRGRLGGCRMNSLRLQQLCVGQTALQKTTTRDFAPVVQVYSVSG